MNANETVTDYNRIIDCLWELKWKAKRDYDETAEAAISRHLDHVESWEGGDGRREAAERIKEAREYDEEYQIIWKPRQIIGLSAMVPDKAIAYKRFPAGHIATTEAERVVYIVKREPGFEDPRSAHDLALEEFSKIASSTSGLNSSTYQSDIGDEFIVWLNNSDEHPTPESELIQWSIDREEQSYLDYYVFRMTLPYETEEENQD